MHLHLESSKLFHNFFGQETDFLIFAIDNNLPSSNFISIRLVDYLKEIQLIVEITRQRTRNITSLSKTFRHEVRLSFHPRQKLQQCWQWHDWPVCQNASGERNNKVVNGCNGAPIIIVAFFFVPITRVVIGS
jgi:hypothetical protein